jgi:hypothetical protein
MRLTLVGGLAIAAFVLSLVLLAHVLKNESRKRRESESRPWPPQTR